MTKTIKSLFFWIPYSLFIYFLYHLVIIPSLLEFSSFGLVGVIGLSALVLFLLRKQERRPILVFTLLFLLLIKSFAGMEKIDTLWQTVVSYVFVFILSFLVARFYGKLSFPAIVSLLLVSFTLNLLFIRSELPLLTHFKKTFVSNKLYIGDASEYFPILVKDIDKDGKQELITLGNTDEYKQDTKEQKTSSPETNSQLKKEQLHIYAYKWSGATMVRIPENQLDSKSIMAEFPVDYIGFPYYYMNSNLELIPQMQRPELTNKMIHFGESPMQAMLLDINNLSKNLEENKGIVAQATSFPSSNFKDVMIKDGQLSGTFKGTKFTYATDATTIVGPLRLTGAQEGLLISGKQLGILTVGPTGAVSLSHVLTDGQIQELATSEFRIADVDNDKLDEVLISSSYSQMIKPTANGNWDILWSSSDKSFRFEDYAALSQANHKELIVLEKSKYRDNPLRYVSSYDYSPTGLQRNWKVFVSLINLRTGDFNGDGKNELAAVDYGSRRVLLLERHNLPVLPILSGILVILLGYLTIRRIRK